MPALPERCEQPSGCGCPAVAATSPRAQPPICGAPGSSRRELNSSPLNLANASVTAIEGNGSTAITGQQFVDQLNAIFNLWGITASIDSTTGQLSFSGGSTAFAVNAAAAREVHGLAIWSARRRFDMPSRSL